MGDTKPSGKLASATINFDLFLLIVVPYTIVKFEVNPFGYVRHFAGDHFDAPALLLTKWNSVEDVGLVN